MILMGCSHVAAPPAAPVASASNLAIDPALRAELAKGYVVRVGSCSVVYDLWDDVYVVDDTLRTKQLEVAMRACRA